MEHFKNMQLSDIQGEIWLDVIGYEGYYQVSNLGRIKSVERVVPFKTTFKKIDCKIIHQRNCNGYLAVSIKKHGIKLNTLVHRLSAQSFLPNPTNKRTVNHKNGIKTDNRLSNLEWATDGENHLHSYRELGRKRAMLGKSGKDSHSSKIVLQLTLTGEFVAKYYGTCEAARETKIQQTSISSCCCGKRGTAGGFIWKYNLTT